MLLLLICDALYSGIGGSPGDMWRSAERSHSRVCICVCRERHHCAFACARGATGLAYRLPTLNMKMQLPTCPHVLQERSFGRLRSRKCLAITALCGIRDMLLVVVFDCLADCVQGTTF